MPEPFGKLNRRVVVKADAKPVAKKKNDPARTSQSGSNTKLYLYVAGGVLFLLTAGYAFAL